MLRIENLCAGYGDVDVIHQLSLDVLPNEVVGVLGCNGAGKSTLVKAIMGLLARTSGTVHFLEQPLNGLRTHEIARRGIGLVPQGRWIFPRLTVRENLLMGTQAAGGADCPSRAGRSPVESSRSSPYPARCAAVQSCCCSTSPPTGCSRTWSSASGR
jgi:ABC-type branched-subunit amino acid transport system ATPase component